MVLIEFRIPLPIERKSYLVAELYTLHKYKSLFNLVKDFIKTEKINKINDEAEEGIYLYQFFYLYEFIEKNIRCFLPTSWLTFQRHIWNTKSILYSEIFNNSLGSTNNKILTYTILSGNGSNENVFKLSEYELNIRSVVRLNIADNSQLDPLLYDKNYDPTLIKSFKVNTLPLEKGFADNFESIHCCYALLDLTIK
ncbi:hypothetical protein HZS_5581, partial [Henneguya salminicola]